MSKFSILLRCFEHLLRHKNKPSLLNCFLIITSVHTISKEFDLTLHFKLMTAISPPKHAADKAVTNRFENVMNHFIWKSETPSFRFLLQLIDCC